MADANELYPGLQDLGRAARAKRKQEGLSQKALADIAGCSHVSIIALEKGTGRVRLDTAWLILGTLGLVGARDSSR